MRDWINKIHCIDWIRGLESLPNDSIDMLITSPPYWGLRDYGLEPIVFDEESGCKHKWGEKIIHRKYGNVGSSPRVGNQKIDSMKGTENQGNFCSKCGAWQGQLGLEPNPELYINHLVQGFTEAKRVLRGTGTCWVNLGGYLFCSKVV